MIVSSRLQCHKLFVPCAFLVFASRPRRPRSGDGMGITFECVVRVRVGVKHPSSRILELVAYGKAIRAQSPFLKGFQAEISGSEVFEKEKN